MPRMAQRGHGPEILVLTSRQLDPLDPEVEALYELWHDKLERSGSVDAAWVLVLTALWRDPLALTY